MADELLYTPVDEEQTEEVMTPVNQGQPSNVPTEQELMSVAPTAEVASGEPVATVTGPMTTEQPTVATGVKLDTIDVNGETLYAPSNIASYDVMLRGLSPDDAKKKLKDLYENIKWTDSEKAAEEISKLAADVNEREGVHPQPDTSGLTDLNYLLLSSSYTKEEKLDAIEQWRSSKKKEAYGSGEFEKVFNAYATEDEVDAIANSLRLGIVTEDVGVLQDHFTRGVEAAFGPIWGAYDAINGTNVKEDTINYMFSESKNPKYEGTVGANLAGVVGNIAGGIVSSANPVTLYGYLGALAVDQLKTVHDEAYKATESEEQAAEAVRKAIAPVGLGLVADRLMLGGIGKAAKLSAAAKVATEAGKEAITKSNQLGFAGSMFAGAVGNAVQEAGSKAALVSATGKEEFTPTLLGTLETAAYGAVGGGLAQAAGKVVEHAMMSPYEKARAAVEQAVKDANAKFEANKATKAAKEKIVKQPELSPEDYVTSAERDLEFVREQAKQLEVDKDFAEPPSKDMEPEVQAEGVFTDKYDNNYAEWKDSRIKNYYSWEGLLSDINSRDDAETIGNWKVLPLPSLGEVVAIHPTQLRQLHFKLSDRLTDENFNKLYAETKAYLHKNPILLDKELPAPPEDNGFLAKLLGALNEEGRDVVLDGSTEIRSMKRMGLVDTKTPINEDIVTTKDTDNTSSTIPAYEYEYSSGYVPGVAVNYVANKFMTAFEYAKSFMGLKSNLEAGTRGEVGVAGNTKTGQGILSYALNRNLAALGPEQATKTAAHELGHLISIINRVKDYVASGKGTDEAGVANFSSKNWRDYLDNNPIIGKLLGVYDKAKVAIGDPKLAEQAKQLSKEWRPNKYWESTDPTHSPEVVEQTNKYRNSTDEIYADVMSAYLTHPEYVSKQFPELMKALNTATAKDSILGPFLKDWHEMQQDPIKMRQWMSSLKESSFREHYNIQKQALEDRIADQHPGMKKTWQRLKKAIVVKAGNVRTEVRSGVKRLKLGEEGWKLYSQTYAAIDAHNRIREELDGPMNQWVTKVNEADISKATDSKVKAAENHKHLDDYLEYSRIINETNTAIEDIKADRTDQYADANEMLGIMFDGFMHQDAETSKAFEEATMLNPFRRIDPQGKVGEELANTLAKLKYEVGELDKVKDSKGPSLMDAFSEYVQGVKNGADYASDVRQKLTEFMEQKYGIRLEDEIAASGAENTDPIKLIMDNYGKAIDALLAPQDTFRVRKYLFNPKGMDADVAQTNLDLLEKELGTDRFKRLKEVAQEFHDNIHTASFNIIKESGRLTPEMLQHIELNKNNWANFNILKYFADNPQFTAAIRAQIGTVADKGAIVPSTIGKTKALMWASERQTAENAVVELAKRGGFGIEEVKKEYKKSIFDQKKLLQEKDKNSSYLIQAKDGKYSLYKIADKSLGLILEKADKNGTDVSVLKNFFKFTEGFNKITLQREMKTTRNPVFMIRQEVMDRVREAMIDGNFRPVVWTRHIFNKKLNNLLKANAKIIREFQKTGYKDAKLAFLADQHTVSLRYPEEMGGFYKTAANPEDRVLESLGMEKLPEENKSGIANKLNNTFNNLLDKLNFGGYGFKSIRERVEFGEMLTKMNVYDILLSKGMGKYEAAAKAREMAGTPDPLGGGQWAPEINKLFLFGRAQINGMRSLSTLFENNPKMMAAQYTYRRLLPKLMASSWFMAPLMGALFGKESEDLTRKFLDKIPSFDIMTKTIIPLGWIDSNGNYRGLDSVSSKDVTSDWKALHLRMPAERELVTIDQITNPIFKNIEYMVKTGELSVSKFLETLGDSAKMIAGGNITPAIQTAMQMGTLVAGRNPQDYFRNRDIVSPDTMAAGDTLGAAYEYLLWSMKNAYPNMFTFSPRTEAPSNVTNEFDMVRKTPVIGSIISGFSSQTNYGDYEKGKFAKEQKEKMDARIRTLMGPATEQLYADYRKYNQMVSNNPEWKKDANISSFDKSRIKSSQRWHANYYGDMFNAMRKAYEKGDKKEIKRLAEAMEESSQDKLKYMQEAKMLKR